MWRSRHRGEHSEDWGSIVLAGRREEHPVWWHGRQVPRSGWPFLLCICMCGSCYSSHSLRSTYGYLRLRRVQSASPRCPPSRRHLRCYPRRDLRHTSASLADVLLHLCNSRFHRLYGLTVHQAFRYFRIYKKDILRFKLVVSRVSDFASVLSLC